MKKKESHEKEEENNTQISLPYNMAPSSSLEWNPQGLWLINWLGNSTSKSHQRCRKTGDNLVVSF